MKIDKHLKLSLIISIIIHVIILTIIINTNLHIKDRSNSNVVKARFVILKSSSIKNIKNSKTTTKNTRVKNKRQKSKKIIKKIKKNKTLLNKALDYNFDNEILEKLTKTKSENHKKSTKKFKKKYNNKFEVSKKIIKSIDINNQKNIKNETFSLKSENIKKTNTSDKNLAKNNIFKNNSKNESKIKNINEIKDEILAENMGQKLNLKVLGSSGKAIWDKNNKLPPYPKIAIEKSMEGKVVLIINIDPNGNVKKVIISKKSGYNVLDITSLKSAKSWKIFIEKNGKYINGKVSITLNFNLI